MSLDVDFDAAERIAAALRLEPEEHRYFLQPDEKELPGVTAALEDVGINDYSHVPATILAQAQERGRQVHAARHLEDEFGDLDESTCSDEVLGHLNGWREFRRVMRFEPLLSEQMLYTPPDNGRIMPVAGTLDALGIVPDPPRLVLVDLKTGNPLPPGVGPQTAGYALLCRMLGIADPAERWCVQTFTDGSYKLHPLASTLDQHALIGAVWLWHWKRGFR